jgi:hypothetical protein
MNHSTMRMFALQSMQRATTKVIFFLTNKSAYRFPSDDFYSGLWLLPEAAVNATCLADFHQSLMFRQQQPPPRAILSRLVPIDRFSAQPGLHPYRSGSW